MKIELSVMTVGEANSALEVVESYLQDYTSRGSTLTGEDLVTAALGDSIRNDTRALVEPLAILYQKLFAVRALSRMRGKPTVSLAIAA